MEGITIEVCGVPDLLPVDRTVDKLTIHFLRPRNGGGEVVKVIYPTSTKGQAFVVFEQKEVAVNVASKKQTLDIGLLDGQQFPLEVAIIDGSEEDLPVQATLDLSKFLDQRSEVHRLLRKHNFEVTELGPGKVLLKGTFLGLRAVRSQLLTLLPQGHSTQHSRERSASASNGTTTAHHDLLPRKSSTLPHANGGGSTRGCGNEWYSLSHMPQRHFSPESSPGYRSPTPPSLDSSSGSSDQPFPLSTSHRSRERVRNHHQRQLPSYLLQDSDAPQSLPILPSERLTGKPPLQSRALSPREMSPRALSPMETARREASSKETSFGVDSNGFSYTYSFKKDQVDSILVSHGVSVSTVSDDSGITILTLKGKDCEGAKPKLEGLINDTSMSLRVQEILLTQFSHDEKAQISKRIQMFKDLYKVLFKQEGSSVFIIGPSGESYEMKQRVLGESVHSGGSTRVGRGAERGQRITRSSSLPKQPKVRPDPDQSKRVDYPHGSSSTMPYSPSHYQDEKHVSGAAAGAEPRRRTSSESRDQTTSRRPVPTATAQDVLPVSSSSGKAPQLKSLLSFNSTAITNRFKNMTGKRSSKS